MGTTVANDSPDTGEDGVGGHEPERESRRKTQCYYDDDVICHGELWTCLTCGESYCQGHWHSTDKGENVECVSCEYQRVVNPNFPSRI